ncbi:hypothetical protein Sta7437_4352 [Stanieria cyanosphaera PCC 7437]|uniref:Uncharacterized protein n=1 Tax=Stanieria cyanosphaera (strain ATCC 29371 / PCC 7437) TaxID=111780 RepID=K9Y0A6_STAC7|nr:hypothetical protein [Stanieria cyanosphaera]AFZ37821.1 hypothetical protein Sta7437_4352 [Stanieria cyanosphaera PCC 7437]
MKSQTLPSFWDNYKLLTEKTRRSARKAYQLWKKNPLFHLCILNVLIVKRIFGQLELVVVIVRSVF